MEALIGGTKLAATGNGFSIAALMASRKIEAKIEKKSSECETDVDEDDQCSSSSSPLLRQQTPPEPTEKPAKDLKLKAEKSLVKQRVQEKCTCPELSKVHCTLDNKELWDKFCEFGTEMIITRTGRRMFPTVRVSFGNLDAEPGVKYLVLLDIVPCDNKRYRYAYHRSAWLVAGKADPAPPHRIYPHPDGPFTPEQLNKQVVSFEKVKVTNNETDNTGQLILNSMHKFQPRVYLVKRAASQAGQPVQDIEREQYRSFVFTETQFTAVTAYQNQLITKLKIQSNPFAKGFRDSGCSDYEEPMMGSIPGLPYPPPVSSGMYGSYDPRTAHPAYVSASHHEALMLDKARLMSLMMQRSNHPLFAAQPPNPPTSLPSGFPGFLPGFPGGLPQPALTPEIIARYTAMQASLAMYSNQSLLSAAFLRQAASLSSPVMPQTTIPSPFLTPTDRNSPPPRRLQQSPRSRSPSLSPGREDSGRAYPATPPLSSPPRCFSPQSTASSLSSP